MNGDGGAYNLPTTYDRSLVTCSLSTSVTICLMKFAVGERNVAIRYSFLRLGASDSSMLELVHYTNF